MAINLRELDGVAFIDVKNDITNETVGEFKEVLQNLADQGKDRVLMDLTEVNYLCSSGLAIIGNIIKRLEANKGILGVINAQDRVMRLFTMTKLSDHLSFFDNCEDAIAALQKR